MLEFVPLDLVDNILLDYHVGHALVGLLVLIVLGSIVQGSRRLLALNLVVFGLIFALTPASLVPTGYKLLGVGLMLLGPVLYTTATD